MDIKQLEIFCEVYRQKGFSPAAKRLGLTQSAVSQRVRALEEELGSPLFDPDNRSTPTAAGDCLFEEARLILAQVNDVKGKIRHASGIGGGAVRFGMIDVAAIKLMPRVLKKFKTAYPKVELEAVVKATGELIEMVEGNSLDFAVAVTEGIPDTLSYENIHADSIVAVVPVGSALSKKKLSIADLKGESLILYPPQSHSRHIIDNAFRAHGMVPAVSMEMHYPAAICSLVEQGMGIGLLSKISADENAMEGQRIVSIEELAGARQIGIIVHKRRRLSPQSKALIDMIVGSSRKK